MRGMTASSSSLLRTLGVVVVVMTMMSFVTGDTNNNDSDKVSWSYGMLVKSGLQGEICFSYPSNIYSLQNSSKQVVVNWTKVNPCAPNNQEEEQWSGDNGSIYLMTPQDNCSTLFSYIQYVHSAGGATAALLLSSDTALPINQTTSQLLNLIAYLSPVTTKTLLSWMDGGQMVEVQLEDVDVDVDVGRRFEWGTVALGALACCCVFVGAFTGPFISQSAASTENQFLSNEGADGEECAAVERRKAGTVKFTVKLVLTLVLFISVMLVLLRYFYQYLVYFFMAVFCFASGTATFHILCQVFALCRADSCLPRVKGHGVHKYLIGILCVALPITWFLQRHTQNIWILEDFLGICFCIHLIQSLRIPNLRICSYLLCLLFIYDIFMVFITPFITPDGKSVMIEVATGAGTDEKLPLVLKIPYLGQLPPCTTPGYSLLGFGDIIIPGILVAFCHSCDIMLANKRRSYFLASFAGYVVGLSLAFIALMLMEMGQPALLYLVPCTLTPIVVMAACRHQLKQMWTGTFLPVPMRSDP